MFSEKAIINIVIGMLVLKTVPPCKQRSLKPLINLWTNVPISDGYHLNKLPVMKMCLMKVVLGACY